MHRIDWLMAPFYIKEYEVPFPHASVVHTAVVFNKDNSIKMFQKLHPKGIKT